MFFSLLHVMYYNYILYNDENKATYNGYTTDYVRRLRQHNGELAGGAKGTSRHRGKWKFLVVVTSPQFTKESAMSFEWYVRYPTGKKPRPAEYKGPEGRLKGLELAMGHEKFKAFEFVFVHKETL